MNDKKKEKLRGKLVAFMQQYRRKKAAHDPNDRHYVRELEKKIKKMRPEELDELLND